MFMKMTCQIKSSHQQILTKRVIDSQQAIIFDLKLLIFVVVLLEVKLYLQVNSLKLIGYQPTGSVNSVGQIKESNEEIIAKLGVYVTKWIDYSTKYGLGYMLSDGTSGVAFNDHTKLVMPKSMT